ncbi:GNAT family N-acetyltransferase [Parapusillimonas sp. SGNA-6]|nr:GNAT family N-acetyltransferase [Parapusillimonas sp. SGNA-6]
MTANYQVRTMRRDELDFAVELAAKEGWNPGIHDAEAFLATDPGGFLVGVLNDELIGCVSAVRYDQKFGFLGFYIVVPAYRGRGYGLALWNGALEQLGTRNIGLDGVKEQQANYRKSGFSLAYSNIRYAWDKRSPSGAAAAPHIAPVGQIDTDTIARYDRLCFPASRSAFLDVWLNQPDSVARAWWENDTLRGYGVIRRCRTGWKVGPLFADNREIAESLLLALSRDIGDDGPVYLDVPEVNIAAMRLAADFGMHEVFGTARMYSRSLPGIDTNRVFGVTTFELG